MLNGTLKQAEVDLELLLLGLRRNHPGLLNRNKILEVNHHSNVRTVIPRTIELRGLTNLVAMIRSSNTGIIARITKRLIRNVNNNTARIGTISVCINSHRRHPGFIMNYHPKTFRFWSQTNMTRSFVKERNRKLH